MRQPWWDLARYTPRHRRLMHRSIHGEKLEPWDQFYYDTFDPHEWWTAPFHRVCLGLYAAMMIALLIRWGFFS